MELFCTRNCVASYRLAIEYKLHGKGGKIVLFFFLILVLVFSPSLSPLAGIEINDDAALKDTRDLFWGMMQEV